MENKALQVFNNPEFGKVRVVTIDKEPWFVGKDVAVALGYSNTKGALAKHVDKEDKFCPQNGAPSIKDSLGRDQYPVFINESGVYTLIFGSKLPTAKKFKRWLINECLSGIRKHKSAIDQMINNPDTYIALLQKYKELKQENERMRARLNYSKERYSIRRVVQLNGIPRESVDWRKLKQVSTDLGIGVKKIFDANYGEVNTYHIKAWEIAYPELEL